jgi:RNA polymerase sigma factor (sigma-70 family)
LAATTAKAETVRPPMETTNMFTPEPIVSVVDDDPAVLKAVARLLRSAGFNVAAFATPREFLEDHDPRSHGCVVLDVAMPGLDGLALQREMTSEGPGLPIVFLSGRGDIPTSVRAMKQGAVDFLTKPVDDEQLVAAVRFAVERDRAAAMERTEAAELRDRLAALTPREREVMQLVVSGMLNKQIAADLGVSEKTIKVHRGRVMEKMQADSLADLVRLAGRANPPAC